jgi:hypothetical protein
MKMNFKCKSLGCSGELKELDFKKAICNICNRVFDLEEVGDTVVLQPQNAEEPIVEESEIEDEEEPEEE